MDSSSRENSRSYDDGSHTGVAAAAAGGAEDSWEMLPILAYEEEPPIVKSRKEILLEKLVALKRFEYAPKEAPENDGSGAAMYLDVCDRIHKTSYMRFPMAGIAKDLQAERETLDLSHAGLGRKGAAALSAALRINSSASALVLAGNHITPVAARDIVRAINESRLIASVDFSANRLGSSEAMAGPVGGNGGATAVTVRGGAVVSELLASGSIVTHLSLRGNHLTDHDVALFADTLAENVNLQSLDLSDNNFGSTAAATLASVLSRNSDLRTINLEWNRFGPIACRLLLAEGFLQNNTIKAFNLSSCGLDDTSAQLLARIISDNAAEEITIANNRLTAVGAEVIAKALSPDSALTALVMDGNNIGEAGCAALVAVATACLEQGGNDGSPGGKSFRLLSLQHCGCSPELEAQYRAAGGSNTDSGIRISEGFGNMILSS